MSSNFLEKMLKESDAYSTMEMIESFVEQGVSLHNIPLQPLYLALKDLSPTQVQEYLPALSSEQRSLMQDLDIWTKDELDPDEFEFWIQSFAQCLDDEVRSEFANGIPFLLYLKGRFNIWTFDVEDPQYPDHDNYFLSDDSLLLFEFHADFPYVAEVRALIREIYSEMGVEKAYTWIFKMVSESALTIVEDEYQAKKGRLNDAGFVDYYDALRIDNPFANMSYLEHELRKKTSLSVGVSTFSKSQVLPKKALSPFRDSFSSFDSELLKLKDEKRQAYLRFNFLRLVNGNVALRGSFKDGAIAINRAGEKTKYCLLLGFDYLLNKGSEFFTVGEEGIFELFDFTEIFRIGNSLIRFTQGDLKKALRVEGNLEAFLGRSLNEFIDHSLDVPVRYCPNPDERASYIDNVKTYEAWKEQADLVCAMMPFIVRLYKDFKPLKESGRIQDHFYLNYQVDDIDFEAVLISSFANFVLLQRGSLGQDQIEKGKLGLTLKEMREFVSALFNGGEEVDETSFTDFASAFKTSFGFDQITHFEDFFLTLIKSQLEGYDYANLADEEFAHVGGPILLNYQ